MSTPSDLVKRIRAYHYGLADEVEQLERELAEARERIKGYEAQAQSFHEEYRRKCDVETKELQERLSDTQHRNGANIVRLEKAEAEATHLRMQIGYIVAELQIAGDKRSTPEIVETAAKACA